MNKVMDINKMSSTELKAIMFDLIQQRDNINNQLQTVSVVLNKKLKEEDDQKIKEAKKKVEETKSKKK